MSESKNIYPWQAEVWQHLNQDIKRLPHALLLHGRAGIGKYDFVRHYSQSLLCINPNSQGEACGVCSSCGWFSENSHPDFRVLSPEQESDSGDESVSTKKTKKKKRGKGRKGRKEGRDIYLRPWPRSRRRAPRSRP